MHSGRHYSSFELHRPELEKFGSGDIAERWSCDIQDVTGLSGSKSDLTKFVSMDDMVEKNSPEMIDEISEAKLRKNLAHNEIRILQCDCRSDYFARHLWDGRVFLMNSGDSHHFAAARYIASRIGHPVPLTGTMHTYSINAPALFSLLRDFDLYAISDEPEVGNAFHDAMRSFKATYAWHHMPRPHDKSRAILLPKDDPRSVRVSRVLRSAGVSDLGRHLSVLCSHQSAMS